MSRQRRERGNTGGSGRVSARGIAERLGLPVPALMNILNQLGHAGLVTSTRGPNGGYYLIKEPNDITLGDIVRATEGPFELVFCVGDAPRKNCPRKDDCVASEMWMDLSGQIGEFFDSIAISDLCDRAREAGVQREYDHPYTYHI